MWCSSIRSRLAVLGSALLAACSLASSAAHAQQRDETWVISQIKAGKFEELRSVEKLSDEGVPLAMYWWGTLLDHCVFERCNKAAARALFLRAAKAGYGRAQAAVYATAISPTEFAQMRAEVGVPNESYARLTYTIRSLLVAAPLKGDAGSFFFRPLDEADPKARADFVALATSDRQLWLLAVLVELDGMLKRADELRAVANSGYVGTSERVIQSEIIRRATHPQMLERARAGELWLAAAYCDTRAIEKGEHILPPDTLPVCERAATQGFPGAVRALLRHHHHDKNHRAAEYFADVCEALLGSHCAVEIAEYYVDRRDESAGLNAKWKPWALAAGLEDKRRRRIELSSAVMDVFQEGLRRETEALRRSFYTLSVRTSLIMEACLTQRLDPATGGIESNPLCPWRKPIAIPAEFLSGAR